MFTTEMLVFINVPETASLRHRSGVRFTQVNHFQQLRLPIITNKSCINCLLTEKNKQKTTENIFEITDAQFTFYKSMK